MSQVMGLGEFDIIARYFATPRPLGDVLLGIGDDAAVLNVRADRNSSSRWTPSPTAFTPLAPRRRHGYRALAVNLSDLAAMGADRRG